MRAMKSRLAKEIIRAGVKIPLSHGAKIEHDGKIYVVKKVPKAS